MTKGVLFNSTNSTLEGPSTDTWAFPIAIGIWTKNTKVQGNGDTTVASIKAAGAPPHRFLAAINYSSDRTPTIGVNSRDDGDVQYVFGGTTPSDSWHFVVAVFNSASSRAIYLNNNAAVVSSTNSSLSLSALNRIQVGQFAPQPSSYAHLCIWQGTVPTATEIGQMAGGKHPLDVQTASIVDYWDLENTGLTGSGASTHTGLKGRVLTGSNLGVVTNSPPVNASTAPVAVSWTGGTVAAQTGQVNVAYTSLTTLAAGFSGNQTPFIYSIATGALPAGLTLNTSTGVISGTPTASGSFSVTVRATDAASNTAVTGTIAFTIAAAAAIVFNGTIPAQTPQATIPFSANFASYWGTGQTPYTWSVFAGALPAGLSLNAATGVVSGTPTTAGSGSFTLRATDANSNTANSNSVSWTVSAAPAPSPVAFSGTVAPIQVNKNASFSIDLASYFTGTLLPFTYSSTGAALPSGVALGGSILSGLLTSAQALTGVKIRATDTGANFAETNLFNILINEVLQGASSTLPVAGAAHEFYVSLVDQSNTKLNKYAPTLAVGDVKISKDGGAFTNITNLPTVTPSGGPAVKVSLTAAEMNAGYIVVMFRDVAGNEWCDLLVSVATSAATGLPSGGSGLTAEQTRAAVWDLSNTGQRVAGSAGAQLQNIDARVTATT